MKSYCALAFLAVLAGAFAQGGSDAPPCSKQMELEMRCMLNVETSPEAQMLKDRMKQSFKTCVPDYPQECHAEFEAAHECKISIAKNVDSDPLFKESKSKSGPAVDACFEKYPVNVKKGMMEIFSMGGKHGKFQHKKWNHHKKNSTSSGESGQSSAESGGQSGGQSGESGETSSEMSNSSNETSSERRHGGGGKHGGGGGGGKHGGGGHGGKGGKGHKCHGRGGHGRHGGGGGRGGGGRHHKGHGPRNFTSGEASSESNSNETSGSASKEHKGGRSGGRSGGMSGERSQCRKTQEQKQCIKTEMKKLANDTALVDVINTLVHQKQKCKQVITWSCQAKCSKKRKCVFKATKPCRQVFMDKMKTCLQEKGFTLPPFMIKEHAQTFTTPVPDVQQ